MGIKGDQLAGSTEKIPTAMKKRTAASLMTTITPVVRALSFTPITSTHVTSNTMIAAGRLTIPPAAEPGAWVAQTGNATPSVLRMLLK